MNKLAIILAMTLPALTGCATAAEARHTGTTKVCWNGVTVFATVACPVKPIVNVINSVVPENAGSALVHVQRSGYLSTSTTYSYATQSATAIADVNFSARSGTLTFAPGQTDSSFAIPVFDDGKVSGDLSLNILLSNISNGTLGSDGTLTVSNVDIPPPPVPAPCPAGTVLTTVGTEQHCLPPPPPPPPPAPTQTCFDGSVIPASDLCPAPPPPPPPPTQKCPDGSVILATATCPVVSTVIPTTGLPSIPSNFDINLGLEATSAIPASSAPDTVGAFRFICLPGQVLPDDPIMYPGKPGASHLHQFYGNTGADGNSTYDSLRKTSGSTCNRIGDGTQFALNRSAYWMPALLNGLGQVVRPDYVAIYYKERPNTDPIVSDQANSRFMGKAVALPNGLRFIFGRDMLNPTANPTGSAYFNCDGTNGAVPGHYATLTEALANCPAGNRVGAIISAPECWDGKNLDSLDHRSHVGYAGYGTWGYLRCDDQHPYVIPTFTMGAWYSIVAGDDTTKWSLSSDAMFPNLPKGATLHADWFGAWDNTTMGMWMDNCINKMLNCSAGDLGNLKRLVGAAVAGNANPRLVPVPTGGM